MPTPRIDIWLPVYNAATTLPEALASIQAQTLTKFRIIAVDDGSTDASPEQLRLAAKTDPRLLVDYQAHQGLVPTLQRCAELSDAPFVFRADADDVNHPERLRLQLDCLQSAVLPTLVGARIGQFPETLRGPGMRRYTDWINSLTTPELLLRDRLAECPIIHSAFAFRRDAYDRAGGYRLQSGPEDLDLLLRLVEQGGTLAVPKSRDPLVWWRLREDSLQRTDCRYQLEGFLEVKLQHLLRLNLIGNRPIIIWGQTQSGKWLARRLQALKTPVAAFIDRDPRKIGHSPYGIPVLDFATFQPSSDHLHLGLVRRNNARETLRSRLLQADLKEWTDFVLLQ